MIVYLDNSATTRQYDQVTKKMLYAMNEDYGNPSSLHSMGLKAQELIENARQEIAGSLEVSPGEICFTGSGTEADNLAIIGAYNAGKRRGNRIITTKGEHSAIIEACRRLEDEGADVVYLDIDSKGFINLDELVANLNEFTILVSIMSVNNELGTINPIEKIGSLIKSKGSAIFHTDAIQAYGKISLDIEKTKIDLLSVSGHKIHGPKGIGALYVKRGLRIVPHIYGGGQEGGLRSGTENTPGIVGMGEASKILKKTFAERMKSIKIAKDYLMEGIISEIPDIKINSPEISSPGILNISFLGCPGQVLLRSLEQEKIYVSTGAACSSKKGGSRVLTSAGLPEEIIESAIRFSFSEFNTPVEMDYVLAQLKRAVASVRRITTSRC